MAYPIMDPAYWCKLGAFPGMTLQQMLDMGQAMIDRGGMFANVAAAANIAAMRTAANRYGKEADRVNLAAVLDHAERMTKNVLPLKQ